MAKKDFGIPGRKTSNSRISVITGITRHDVKKNLETVYPEADAMNERFNRATNIIQSWINNDDFVEEGKPKELSFDEGSINFTELVKRYGGDITIRSIYDELQMSGAIQVLPGGMIRLKKEFYIPTEDLDQKYEILGNDVSRLIKTVNHNIDYSGTSDFLQLSASSLRLPKERAAIIRNEMKHRGIEFLKEIDTWLMSEESKSKPNKNDEDVFTGGIGLFYFEEKEGSHEKE